MFKKLNQNKDYIQSIINKKEHEYELKHKYCGNLYYLLEKDRPDLSQFLISKIIGMIYEKDFAFIENCHTNKEYFLSIVNEGLSLVIEDETKNPKIILKEEKFKYCLQLYNKLQNMHPSMPNLIVGKIIGMIHENNLEFIYTLTQNHFDFLIIIKQALDVLINTTDKESISFYKNNKYDMQNSYNIIVSNFLENETDKKNYLLELIQFKFISYYKFAIENTDEKNIKKIMFSDSTKISESIIVEIINLLFELTIEELEKIIFNINHFKLKCKETINKLRDLVSKSPQDYPNINLIKINTVVNAYFLSP